MATTTTPPTGAGSTPPGRKPGVQPIRPRPAKTGPLIVRFYRSGGRQEVGDGRHRHHPAGLRARPHGRQPEAVLSARSEINPYGEWLRDCPAHLLPRTVLLWMIRTVLILAFVFHIHSAIGLTRMNHKARPAPTGTSRSATTWPPTSRRARCAGPASSSRCSSIFHLVDLTWGNANPHFVRGDPYDNLVYSFQPAGRRDRLHRRQHRARASTCSTARGPCSRASGINNPRYNTLAPLLRAGLRGAHPRRQRQLPDRVQLHAVDAEVPRRETAHGGVPARHVGDAMTLDAKVPEGPIEEKWDNHKFDMKLVNPANKRRFEIIVVGTGLAGASAAATLGELGYQVKVFTFHDSPRRAHSHRRAGRHQRGQELPERRRQRLPPLLRHGEGRRLPRPRGQRVPPRPGVSVDIIDQCVAQGVPFAREYGGLLDNRSLRRRAGVAHVLRPRPDRPAAAARRLPGARAPGARSATSSSTPGPRCSTSS